MEIEAILVALDVGTSKVVVLVGEVTNDGALDIIGKGAMPTTGALSIATSSRAIC